MFEARLNQGRILKQVLDSVKDLVTDANFEADPAEGFKLQAMDSSHVSLVALKLHKDGFEFYRCDRPLTMGMNLANMVRTLARARARIHRDCVRDVRLPFRRERTRCSRLSEDRDVDAGCDATTPSIDVAMDERFLLRNVARDVRTDRSSRAMEEGDESVELIVSLFLNSRARTRLGETRSGEGD
jgi:hypothetical protein